MFLELNDAKHEQVTGEWRPACKLEAIRARAALMHSIRAFFAERDVLEVETPILGRAPVTDPFIQAFMARDQVGKYYCQTSPEYAMKRLLAAGVPSMYQMCKAFRHNESGQLHNPEFTLLEWYRIGFSLPDLMDEMDDFLQAMLGVGQASRFTYRDLFLEMIGIDPFYCTMEMLVSEAEKSNINLLTTQQIDKDDLLQLLFTHLIEPKIGFDVPWFVYDYPPSQAALARIKVGSKVVAERFEVYVHGVELANGYHELDDPKVQAERFIKDCEKRRMLGLPTVPIDHRLVDALAHGLPDCSGVALGVDRLLMLSMGLQNIEEVLTFPWQRS